MSNHTASSDDGQFVQAFFDATLAPAAFDHRAHLRLGYVLLSRQSLDDATATMREGLKHFLAAHGLPAEKFHETLTTAWLTAVDVFMKHALQNDDAPCTSFNQWLKTSTDLLDPKIMLTHYGAKLLFSDEARAAFVAPDISPLHRQTKDDAR